MISTTIRITNASDVGTTGLTGTNIKFRRSPYGGGDEITIAGVSGGTNGVYLCDFTGVPYQLAQLWVDGVQQTTWGTKYIGDPFEEFLSKDVTAEQDIVSDIDMNSKKLKNLTDGSASGDSVNYGQVPKLATENVFTDLNTFEDRIPRNGTGRSYGSSPLEMVDVQYLEENYGSGGGSPYKIYTKRLFVDHNAPEEVTGKIYQTIQNAIAYASTQTPSSTSRWLITVMPHSSAGYAEDITLVRFVDIEGWGEDVYITGGLTTTQITTSQTWTGRDARISNLIFNSTDKSYFFRLLHIESCIAKANGAGGEVSFYIDGCSMENFGIYTQNDVDLQANATEQENRVIDCYGNEEPTWESGDDVGSFTLMNSLYEF